MPVSPRPAPHATRQSSPAEPGWQHRVLALMVRAFPTAFREHYGADLTRCVHEARSALGDVSRLNAIRFWAATFVDVGRQGIRERLGGLGESWAVNTRGIVRTPPASPVRQGLGGLLLAAAAANIVYDVLSIKNSMGILAVLLTAVGAVGGFFLMRPPRPRRPC